MGDTEDVLSGQSEPWPSETTKAEPVKYYCPECGTWYDEEQPYCTGPATEPQQAHKPAFLLKEGDTVKGSDEKGNEIDVTLTAPEES